MIHLDHRVANAPREFGKMTSSRAPSQIQTSIYLTKKTSHAEAFISHS